MILDSIKDNMKGRNKILSGKRVFLNEEKVKKILDGKKDNLSGEELITLFPRLSDFFSINSFKEIEVEENIIGRCVLDERAYRFSGNGSKGDVGFYITYTSGDELNLPFYINLKKFISLSSDSSFRLYFSKDNINFSLERKKEKGRKYIEENNILELTPFTRVSGLAASVYFSLDELGVIKVRDFEVNRRGGLISSCITKDKEGTFERLIFISEENPEASFWDKKYHLRSGKRVYLSLLSESEKRDFKDELKGVLDSDLGKYMEVEKLPESFPKPIKIY